MKPIDDLGDLLAEEVLTDMAETFFGSRVEIDQKLELFEKYTEILKKKGEEVSSRAGFLNFLLIDSHAAADFYTMLNVKPGNLAASQGFSNDALPEKPPRALTARGEYVKLFDFAYDALQKACRRYNRGGETGGGSRKDPTGEGAVTYSMLKYMSEIINEKIKKVNERSTFCTLQYTRQFNPEVIEKEKITGGGFAEHGCENLDRNLKFKPLKFDSYGIPVYPDLPKHDIVKNEVGNFAKNLFSRKTPEGKKALMEIKSKLAYR